MNTEQPTYPVSNGLAPYATLAAESRGRLYAEDEGTTRSPFQRDRDRVIHCATFRRLKHKTQVFVYHEGDYYRTRLTHSIEVAQIARSISRALGLDEDLAEALALAHDFGHPAFGHAGEDALDAAMAPYGGFDHNAQSLRLVTRLEQRYAAFPGLNLTWETLEGLAKHNGPIVSAPINCAHPPDSLPYALRQYLMEQDLEIHTHAGAEAQVAANSDDIAYNNHDLEDGLRAGLFSLDDLRDVPLVGRILAGVRRLYPDIGREILIHETVRRMINAMVVDLLEETKNRIQGLKPRHVDDIRHADHAVVGFSDAMRRDSEELRGFLMTRMYRHPRVMKMADEGKKVVADLFSFYVENPDRMPAEWAAKTEGPKAQKTARVVADFIAGMTDRFALDMYQDIFSKEIK